jgi:hypothetical protein
MKSKTPLSDFFSWGLLMFPQLLEEFPMMVVSLDRNEYIKISSIRDVKLQSFLTNLMKQLPVEENVHRGWSRSNPDESIANYIRQRLLKEGSVKLSKNLSITNSTAFRFGASRIMLIIQSFPELRGELTSFLLNILEGDNVQLDGLDNESVREELEKLLKSIGMEYGVLVAALYFFNIFPLYTSLYSSLHFYFSLCSSPSSHPFSYTC